MPHSDAGPKPDLRIPFNPQGLAQVAASVEYVAQVLGKQIADLEERVAGLEARERMSA